MRSFEISGGMVCAIFREGTIFVFDSRRGQDVLSFSPYGCAARFRVLPKEQSVPAVIISYSPEAFEKLKWLFWHFSRMKFLPQIIIKGTGIGRAAVNLFADLKKFPMGELAKTFQLDFVLEKGIKEARLVIASETTVEIIDWGLFSSVFFKISNGACGLSLREQKRFNCLDSNSVSHAIETGARLLFTANN